MRKSTLRHQGSVKNPTSCHKSVPNESSPGVIRRKAQTSVRGSSTKTDWVIACRLFTATRCDVFIQKARTACRDPRICSLLETDERIGGSTMQSEEVIDTLKHLVREGRQREHDVLLITAYRGAVDLILQSNVSSEKLAAIRTREEIRHASPVEGHPGWTRDSVIERLNRQRTENEKAERICIAMLGLSQKWQFVECEAHYRLALGMQQHATHRWNEAEANLVTAAYQFTELEQQMPGLFARQAALAYHHGGDVLLQLRKFAAAYKVLRCSEEMFSFLTRASPSLVPAQLRVTSLLGETLLALRRFGPAKEKLVSVWEQQRWLGHEYRDEFVFDMCRTGVALSTALLERATTMRGLSDARAVAKETLAETVRLMREGKFDIYIAARGDAECNMGRIFLKLGMFKKAKSSFKNAEVFYFGLRHEPVRYVEKQAEVHFRHGQALAGERRFTRATEELQKALSALQPLGREEARRLGLRYATVYDEIAAVYDAQGNAEGTIAAANMAVLGAESIAVRGAADGPYNIEDAHFAKGAVSRSYTHLAAQAVADGSANAAFRTLAALREGDLLSHYRRVGQGLPEAASALQRLARRTGRPVRIVIAQDAGARGVIFGVLAPSTPPLRTFLVPNARRQMVGLVKDALRVFLGTSFTGDEWRRRISAAGVRAWNALPVALRDALSPGVEGDVLISGDPFWTAYPWEGIFSPEHGFLGLHRPLVRWTPIGPRSLDSLLPCEFGNGSLNAAVICPWNPKGYQSLNDSKSEAQAVASRLKKIGFKLPRSRVRIGKTATAGSLLASLRSEIALIHYTGHGDLDEADECLVLEPDDASPRTGYVGSTQIEIERERHPSDHPLFPAAPLVTLSACLAGHTREFGGMREDLVWKLLSEGATAVIASAHPVFDQLLAPLGLLLYEPEAQQSEGMAWTFAQARRTIERENRAAPTWPSWMFLTYHGNPYARLPRIQN